MLLPVRGERERERENWFIGLPPVLSHLPFLWICLLKGCQEHHTQYFSLPKNAEEALLLAPFIVRLWIQIRPWEFYWTREDRAGDDLQCVTSSVTVSLSPRGWEGQEYKGHHGSVTLFALAVATVPQGYCVFNGVHGQLWPCLGQQGNLWTWSLSVNSLSRNGIRSKTSCTK